MANMKEIKVEKKKLQIMNQAIKIASEKGYHLTTMEDIATELKMTKGSVYYYFENKQHLFFECQVHLINECIKFAQTIVQDNNLSIEEKFSSLIKTHLAFTLQVKGSFDLMAIEQEIFSIEQVQQLKPLRDYYKEYYDVLIIQYLTILNINVKEVTIRRNLLLNAMNGVIKWFSPNGLYDQESIIQIVTKYLLTMIRCE